MSNDWLLLTSDAAGTGVNDNLTRYFPPFGQLNANATETIYQALSRDTYTWKNLYVRVITNTITVAAGSVFRSRKNTANGNQVATYGSDETGVKEDTSNTDSIASGDVFNYSLVTQTEAGTNTVTTTIISTLLTHSSTTAVQGGGSNSAETVDVYIPISGRLAGTTEAAREVTLYYSATFTRLYTNVPTNTATTLAFTIRKNNTNGSNTVSYGASETGTKEDTTNSDSFTSGDEVSTFADINGGSYNVTILQYETSSGFRLANVTGASSISGSNVFGTLMGNAQTGTEADAQVKARTGASFKNLRAYANSNSHVTDCVVAFRVDGASAISVTYATLETGVKEETSTTSTPGTTAAINYGYLPVAGAGTIVVSFTSIEQVAVADTSALKDIIGVGVVPVPR